MNSLPDIYLASRSPRRSELLRQINVCYKVVVPDVPEVQQPNESAHDYVSRLALSKAQAGWQMIDEDEKCPVLGADTIILLDGEILEKPQDRADGLQMMSRLSGVTHQVVTGMALVMNGEAQNQMSVSSVTFRVTTQAEREAYWATGEPLDKAGGYAVQGAAAVFIERIEGSYSSIMGLGLFEVSEMLAQHNISVFK